jgi:ribosomal protein S12 methylthiotransferase accessory factor YcaO
VQVPPENAARELARQLLAREAAAPDPHGSDTTAAADRVCRRVSDELARWIGHDGCRALFARSLATAQAEGHPVLDAVRTSARSVYCLDGLTASAARYGAAAANDGAAAILSALIELLGRLIGDDMALHLVEQSTPAAEPARASTRRNAGGP